MNIGHGKQKANTEFDFVKGVFACILVGITGSAMSLGMEQGKPIADYFERSGADPLFTTIPVMLILLSGTLVTTIIWCLYLGIRNRSLIDYLKCPRPKQFGPIIYFHFGRVAVVYAIYFLRNGEEQDGAIHLYILGYTCRTHYRICHTLGIIRERMEGSFTESLCAYGIFDADNYTLILSDRNKRFAVACENGGHETSGLERFENYHSLT